jgi:hypothetical protein
LIQDISSFACAIKLGVWGEPPEIVLSVTLFIIILLYNRDYNSSYQSDVPLCRFADHHDFIVSQLLSAGANINSINNDDISPLVWAIDRLNMACGMEAMVCRRLRVRRALSHSNSGTPDSKQTHSPSPTNHRLHPVCHVELVNRSDQRTDIIFIGGIDVGTGKQ